MLAAFGLAALGVLSACNRVGTTSVVPTPSTSGTPVPFPGASAFAQSVSNQAVTMNGTTAVIPVPSSAPYSTTISLGTADVVPNTSFTTTITSTLPSGLPLLSVGRRTQAIGSQATILEYIQLTPTADIAGTGGYSVNATIPTSYVQAGSHFWAQACLTPEDATTCNTWLGPFGPATVTSSGATSSLAVTIPLDALAGTLSHTIAVYSISDTVSASPPPSQNTVWTTNGRQIQVNGTPFFVRGVAYSPNWNNVCCLGSPLGAAQQATWTSDLSQWRSMGINAIHVYNVAPTTTSNLDPFLTAAVSGGSPIYVMLEWYFAAPGLYACNNIPAYPSSNGQYCYTVATLNQIRVKYQNLASRWGGYPALMGFVMGTEWNGLSASNFSNALWDELSKISHATRRGLGANKKLLATGLVDDGTGGALPTIVSGQNAMSVSSTPVPQPYDIDVWGYDVYRGPGQGGGCPTANTCLWTQVQNSTLKPFLMTEYGPPESYHSNPGSTTQPNATALANPAPGTTPYPCANVPVSSNSPDMRDVITYYSCVQVGMEQQSAVSGGVASGGFIFEWNDEYWKAGCGTLAFQCGGLNGNSLQTGGPLNTVDSSPLVQYNDGAFQGITTGPSPRTVRQAFCWFQLRWTGSNASPCPLF